MHTSVIRAETAVVFPCLSSLQSISSFSDDKITLFCNSKSRRRVEPKIVFSVMNTKFSLRIRWCFSSSVLLLAVVVALSGTCVNQKY